MNSFSVIPQNKLNALLEEVCRPFDYLSTQINSDASLWDEPIKMCEKIESDPFELYNILREARKHNNLISGINTPRQYMPSCAGSISCSTIAAEITRGI